MQRPQGTWMLINEGVLETFRYITEPSSSYYIIIGENSGRWRGMERVGEEIPEPTGLYHEKIKLKKKLKF